MKTKIKILSLAFVLITAIFTTSSFGQASKKETQIVKLKAAINCNDCKDKIEKAFAYEKGVQEAIASVETKIVTVKYRTDKTNPEKIEKVIDDLGYNASILKGDCTDKNKSKCKSSKKSSCCKKH